MPYRFIEGLTMADIAFEAAGSTLEEMFISAADAMSATQMQDIPALGTGVEKKFRLEAPDVERLLHDFLQELIFLKDAELLIFSRYELKVSKQDAGGWVLEAACRGGSIADRRNSMLVDVKAVSWHRFSVEKTAQGWRAVVIIDV